MTGGRVVSNPRRTLGLLGVLALTISACSSSGATTAPSTAASVAPSTAASVAPTTAPSEAAKPVTINWWHIATGDPGKADFQAIADAYTKANPNVTIKITVTENEAFKTKLAATPGDAYPDLFQSWGGGTMAAQADAGLLQDITAAVAPWKDTVNAGAMSIYQYKGVQYGIPWDMGMIGFWYNKDLFQKAGIAAPPATWDEYLADVPKLKAAGVAPLAIAGKDKWPSMHLWTYLVLRSGGGDALSKMIQSGDWNTDACTNAGRAVLALNALDPYQKGYASADYNSEAASVGNGKAAMELMGQWAPSVQKDQSIGKVGLGDKLGWFAFPTLAGGAGAATDGVGGGNGIAVGKNAPPEAIDFLKFFMSKENQNKLNTDGVGLSTTVGTESSVSDPNLQAVLAGRGAATFMQLYLDQATSGGLAAAFNDATVALFLGKSTPEKVCQTLTDAAATQ
jgi:raffinose/stachyose/melibiose transport system substrate-binding protein